jgi:hypothetical protein
VSIHYAPGASSLISQLMSNSKSKFGSSTFLTTVAHDHRHTDQIAMLTVSMLAGAIHSHSGIWNLESGTQIISFPNSNYLTHVNHLPVGSSISSVISS